MAITQKVFVLNSFGDGSLERRTRTNSSGKSSDRWSVSVDAKPLKIEFDTKTLGANVALTITNHLKARVAGIAAQAAETTQLKRKYAGHALSGLSPWAVKRYAGGKLGFTPPNQSSRLFNDSGRFVRGITAAPTRDNNWVINVAANRLNAAHLGSEGVLKSMVDRLRMYVPEFGSASLLVGVPEVSVAINKAINAIYANRPKGQALREFIKEAAKVALQEIGKSGDDT